MKKYPEVNEVFELTLDGTDPRVQPLAMVLNHGQNSSDWRYLGRTVIFDGGGPVTGKFKLVSVGRCATWYRLITELAALGRIPEGQWLEVFLEAYQNHSGEKAVGVTDAAWVSPDIRANFPYINTEGRLVFEDANRSFNGDWLWLVKVK